MPKMEKSSELAHAGGTSVTVRRGIGASDGHNGKRIQPETQTGALSGDEYKPSY